MQSENQAGDSGDDARGGGEDAGKGLPPSLGFGFRALAHARISGLWEREGDQSTAKALDCGGVAYAGSAAVASALHDAEEGGPGADGVAVLVRHHAGDLV